MATPFFLHKTLSEPGLFSLYHSNSNEHKKVSSDQEVAAPFEGLVLKKEALVADKSSCKLERKAFDQAEFMSAITMVSPSLVSLAFALQRTGPWDMYAWFTFLNTFVHMPFSMMHHFNLGFGDPNEGQVGWGLVFRRLDYSFIHVACVMLSYGLSRSEVFGAIALLVNGYYIFKIWTYDMANGPQDPNVNGVVVTVAMYIFSIAYYGRFCDFILGAVMMASAFIVFKFNLLGEKYSHPAMHVLLGTPQIFFMAHSIDLLCAW